jgi:uncharacterized membrane protein
MVKGYSMAGARLSSIQRVILEFKWDSRAGPILLVNFGQRKLGLALFCHRIPERCFTIFGHESFLCSRCTGIGIGVLAFLGTLLFHAQVPLIARMALIAPMLIDSFSQLLGFRESNNTLRFLTGFSFAVGFLSLLVK